MKRAVKTVLNKQGVSRQERNAMAYNKRLKTMLAAQKAGKNPGEIAEQVGLSRRRVNEILKAHFDAQHIAKAAPAAKPTAKAATKPAVKAAPAKKAAASKQDEKEKPEVVSKTFAQKWGFTQREYELHTGLHGHSSTKGSPMQRYTAQRSKFIAQGCQWLFTFKQWWTMWVASGRWEECGRVQFVLGRKNANDKVMSPDTCHVYYLPDAVHIKRLGEGYATK